MQLLAKGFNQMGVAYVCTIINYSALASSPQALFLFVFSEGLVRDAITRDPRQDLDTT